MLSLTHQEKVVLVFLGALILIGTGISFYLKHTPRPIDTSQLEPERDMSFKVELNNADIDELIRLPGIGPELARRIVEYRNINGAFKQINEIKKVKGIGDKKFEELHKFLIIR